MNQLKTILYCLIAFAMGSVIAFGQEPPAHLCKYLNYSETNGGFSINVNYGQGKGANYAEGPSSVQLQTNDIPAAYAQLKLREEKINARAGNALDELRRTAPPIVQCPCPQQCAPSVPIRGYCGRIVGYTNGQQSCNTTCTTGYCGTTTCTQTNPCCQNSCTSCARSGYCGMERPTCAAPCGTTPYWCGQTRRWCASAGTYWCGRTHRWCNGTDDTYWCTRTNRWCSASTGQYWCGRTNRWCGGAVATTGGSCCSGGGHDGRNGMVLFQPGDPRAVCNCALNPNRGGSCGCPDNCPTCNPRNILGYAN